MPNTLDDALAVFGILVLYFSQELLGRQLDGQLVAAQAASRRPGGAAEEVAPPPEATFTPAGPPQTSTPTSVNQDYAPAILALNITPPDVPTVAPETLTPGPTHTPVPSP